MKKWLFLILVLPVIGHSKNPVWFNSGMNNRDITFSPAGDVMMTTIVAPKNLHSMILMSRRSGSVWTPLEVAPFSGRHPDIEPAFSPDGNYVYFASRRPLADGSDNGWDIWRAAYDEEALTFSEPENLGSPVNSEGNEFYPSLTRDNVLYFTATLKGGLGKEDLYRAIPDEKSTYPTIENVGAPVNSEAYEFNAFIAEDESYLIFGAQRREGEFGGGDLYISFRRDGRFQEPILLPGPINSEKLDYCPAVYRGRFYFTSELARTARPANSQEMSDWYQSPGNGLGDIYYVDWQELLRQLSEL